jgi:hypothetical protein
MLPHTAFEFVQSSSEYSAEVESTARHIGDFCLTANIHNINLC